MKRPQSGVWLVLYASACAVAAITVVHLIAMGTNTLLYGKPTLGKPAIALGAGLGLGVFRFVMRRKEQPVQASSTEDP
jgi:glucokinase